MLKFKKSFPLYQKLLWTNWTRQMLKMDNKLLQKLKNAAKTDQMTEE